MNKAKQKIKTLDIKIDSEAQSSKKHKETQVSAIQLLQLHLKVLSGNTLV